MRSCSTAQKLRGNQWLSNLETITRRFGCFQKFATDDEIKKAFRKLARKYHPDVNKDNEATARGPRSELNEAYKVLGDPGEAEEVRRAWGKLGPTGRFSVAAGMGNAATGRWIFAVPGGGDGGVVGNSNSAALGSAISSKQFFGGGRGRGGFWGRQFGQRPRRGQRSAGATSKPTSWLPSRKRFMGRNGPFRFDEAIRTRSKPIRSRFRKAFTKGNAFGWRGQGEAGAGGGKSGDLFLRVRLAPATRISRSRPAT